MVHYAGCVKGGGIICLDEANACAPCRKDPNVCGWAKYPDIAYVFRSEEVEDGFSIYIPSNAIAINTSRNGVSWLEPVNKKKDEKNKKKDCTENKVLV